ncbi:kynureninase [Sphingomonas sp. GCM10030256]|uniref:kynureninase n=1 Tax=Sphingomonas sp. GCM10030256 TaxID=3273427 RepID=UPI003612F5C5
MTLDEARTLDAADPLAFARQRFRLPDGVVYLDGNSLGALPAVLPARLAEVAERQWGEDLITSWNKHGWIDWPARIAAKLASIVGAEPNELIIADSTSVLLFKLLAGAVAARPGRTVILTEDRNFPSDLYVAQGLAAMQGLKVKAVPAADIVHAFDQQVAAVMLTHVDYRSGQRHDMAAINAAARVAGALTLWDLSHSAGALELSLFADGCDLAVGCGYKYLNGGPGAPAFAYVPTSLQAEIISPVSGWMGHAAPFAFEPVHRPAKGMTRYLSGTPSILALAAMEAGLDTFAGVEMTAVFEKSRALSELFISQVEQQCPDLALASPREPEVRGSHVSFAHPDGYAVMQALIERGIIGDFRAPDLLRFGFAPLYNSFEEVWRAADQLRHVLGNRAYDQPHFRERARVT